MPTDIKLKNSVTATNAPTSLQQGEVAINVTDKKVWVGNAATTPVLLLGSGADGTFTNLTVSGVASFADGTVSLPSITNIGDTNTGIFFPAADTIAFTEGGVESMRIDSSGNVGIGTSSPAARLHATDTSKTSTTVGANTIGRFQSNGSGADTNIQFSDGVANSAFIGMIGNAVYFAPDNTERMRIDSAGNCGIGTSSPIQKLQIVDGSIALTEVYAVRWSSSGGTLRGSVSADSGSNLYFGTGSSNTERMRIDSSGNLFVACTATPSASVAGCQFQNPTVSAPKISAGNTSSATTMLQFFNANGSVGYISTSGTATAYNTSSDYRLKENIAPMTGALNVVQQLKPVTYNWKVDGSSGQGFIAHELQEVVPDCVTGEKDAVDKDGKPVYQGIDTSFLVATLTAAIQELNAKVTALEKQLGAK